MKPKGKLRKLVVTLLAVLLLVPGGFAAPVMAADSGGTVVLQQDFENGDTGGWVKNYACTTDTVVSTVYGTRALHLSGRTSSDCSPEIDLTDILMEGRTYDISLKVRLGSGNDVVHGVTKPTVDGNQQFNWFKEGDKPVSSDDWTILSETDFSRPAGASSITLYVETGSSTADVYIDDVLIIDKTSGEPVDPGQSIVYEETFADGPGVATKAGGVDFEVKSGIVFDGNEDGKALYVSNRSENWNGVDIPFTSVGMQEGKTYTITVKGFIDIDEPVPPDAQALFQNVDSYGDFYVSANYVAGQPFTLTGTYTVDTSVDRALRIQSNEAGKEVSFYIGSILITGEPDSPGFQPIEIAKYDFDDGTAQGWVGRGGNATPSTEMANSGTHSLKVTGRTENWHGAQISLADKILVGAEYEIKAFARLVAGEPDSEIKLSMHLGGDDYTEVTPMTMVTDNAWTELKPSNNFKIDAPGSSMTLYVESSNVNVEFYIDDITITQVTSAPPPDEKEPNTEVFDFEDGPQGWVARGDGTNVEVSNEAKHEGLYSLKVTNRSDNWHGAQRDVKSLLYIGAKYEISAYVKLVDAPASPSEVKISVVRQFEGDASEGYDTVAQAFITDTDWTLLKGTYSFDKNPQSIDLYIESSNAEDEFYIDHVVIKMTEAPKLDLLEDFEDGIGNWKRRFGDIDNIAITNEDNHTEGGTQSLKTTAMQQYDGPLLDVRGKMHRGHQYELSSWVKMAQGESPTVLRISVQYGESSFANVSADVQVTDQEWVKLSGRYIQSTRVGDVLNAYVEVANNYGEERTFLIDDFELKYIGPVAGPNPDYSLPSIQEVYDAYFPIGNIMNPGDFEEGDRLQMLKKHHTLLSAENFMKPEYAYKSNSRDFDLSNQIALVEEALDNGFDVHGHVLVWHAQSPDWLHTKVNANGTPIQDGDGNIVYLDKEEALENLREHVKTVVEEIGDRVISWDVVNEAMNDNPPNPTDWKNALRRSGWFHAIGPDYLYEAYKTAREVIEENGWDIELYYNDYNDDNQNKMIAITSMVKELNDRYAKDPESTGKKLIDGIGMQAHYNLNTNPDNVRASIERIIDLDVKVGITELDIMAGDNGTQTEEQAIRQGYLYAQLFQLYKEYADHITRVTFWGVDDGTSWRTENSPLLFDNRFQAKPAYYGVIDPEKFIKENPPAEKDYLKSTANYGTPVIDGSEDAVWNKATALPITRYQTAHNGATGVAKVLWDDHHLYVLIKVNDTVLDDTSGEAHEQDSVEVFLDETNSKSSSYGPGVGQYRVNFNNVATFNPASISDGFESATVVSATYTDYTVEMKIPFKTITPRNNLMIGFDAQINDAESGSRQSVASWNDLSGQGWQDPSVFGALTLAGKPGSGGGGGAPSPAPALEPGDDGTVTIKPPVTTENGRAKASPSIDNLQRALEQAVTDESGKKKLVIEIDAEEGIGAIDVELPKASLTSEEAFVISVKTPRGTIDIPNNMLDGIALEAETVTIAVAKADLAALDEHVRGQIGSRPAISLNVLADGEVIAWNNPQAPVTIAIPYEPTDEELANPDHIVVWYIDGDGNATAIPNGRYDAESGSVVFRTTHFSTYAVNYVVKTFADLSGVPWAKASIDAMASRDVIAGVSATSFNPAANIKRADFVALLVRALELQDTGEAVTMFSDVKETDYFYNEVKIAKQLGIASGTGDNRFNPNGLITRQDMMVLADLALQAAGKSLQAQQGALVQFQDADDVANYARASAEKLVANGIVNGMRGKLAPQEQLTRAQAAVILYQLWRY